LQMTGSRVVIPDTHRLIAPWTEKVRYGVKKNGYHGGVSPFPPQPGGTNRFWSGLQAKRLRYP
jgi:hypothetical protein